MSFLLKFFSILNLLLFLVFSNLLLSNFLLIIVELLILIFIFEFIPLFSIFLFFFLLKAFFLLMKYFLNDIIEFLLVQAELRGYSVGLFFFFIIKFHSIYDIRFKFMNYGIICLFFIR